ncbi:NACHT domain-containing protein [Mycena sanguinolenta]|uniref:NACHT domain-containing protein n=1 Tax=Mycena sanguinolenta TaxID=230812 RepID=A0A8H6Z8P1_9AGAR|nr:NACHT domain-containing protein [Mycena sanguinolenta]
MRPDVQTMNNYINGGRGGAGGEGHANGRGGAGGDGMGPSVKFDIRPRGNFTMNNMQHGDRGIEMLHRTVALEAIHDSADSFSQPKCHPETRTQMLQDLREWALDSNPRTTVLWFYGPAGAGKSAVMQTLAGELQVVQRLGGCFFFKRGHATRGNSKTLFATIAYQLALNVEDLRIPISGVVEKNPSIMTRSMATQMQQLISEPCFSHKYRDPVTIIIDGLDECEGRDVQQEILRVIRIAASQPRIPFRFIVASRPEPHIHEMIKSPLSSDSHCSFNVEQCADDVRKYLRDEFARIHHEHRTMTRIPLPWPSLEILEHLVQKSSGYFIYASTIIKFIDDKNYRPTQRLTLVLHENSTGSGSAFDALDQLYMTVLCSSPRQSELIPILCAIVHLDVGAREIDLRFGLADGEAQLLLQGLHSVLNVPDHDYGTISSHHASFLDFLNNACRSQMFSVDGLDRRMKLARSVLEICVGRGDGKTRGYSLTRSEYTLSRNLIPFIISLPPSAELCTSIGRVGPEFVFTSDRANPRGMLSWLEGIPAPPDVIALWEDYTDMFSFDEAIAHGRMFRMISAKRTDIASRNPKLPQVLVAMVFVGLSSFGRLLQPAIVLLDITWGELRTIICGPRTTTDASSVEPQMLSLGEFPRYQWASRDLALRSIHRVVEGCVDSPPDEIYWKCVLPFVVRLSPPCPVLYRELGSITSDLWLELCDAALLSFATLAIGHTEAALNGAKGGP